MSASQFAMQDLARLTDDDLAEVARSIKVEPEALGAVYDVESAGSGYWSDGTCKQRFENGIWTGTYGHPSIAGDANDYDTLNRAIAIDETDALASTSWGLFQVMGFNWSYCDVDSPQEHVREHCISERRQLELVACFLTQYQGGECAQALREHDWAGFAYSYNGPNYAANNYDMKLEAAYNARKAGGGSTPPPVPSGKPVLQAGSRGEDVADLQERLNRWGPLDVDGAFGAATTNRVKAFQAEQGLVADGIVGDATWRALEPWA